ncbi:ferric-dicitrate binding protein FerR (iron transport regulator) [Pedobacter sp. AK017]|uniref:FecR family protein n=1 Tax=Pedobacter sp. AK017 TaxID=2723073 RepID=UPI00161ABDD4|nr:FecR family protein [Pedobacter sp. AK017]MBB5437334.1 ferric-dicitrate binding protein FerR (iron transport regulator) [Pedobacter sp. AK017]
MKEAEELLTKYRTGLCTPEEVQLLQKWFHHLGEEEMSELSAEDLIAARLKFERNITGSILPSQGYKLWPRIAIAAAAVAAIVFGVFFFKAPVTPEPGSGSANYTNDIAPGKNTATLTLANGKTIILSDVKTGVIVAGNSLKYNDGTEVLSSSRQSEATRDLSHSFEMTVITPRGGTYQVRLPDGTKVWLNAASSLTYYAPLIERGGVRKVELSGEAYFEVFKNKNQPFVVIAKNLTTTVLGTHFNISAYEDEPSIKATLLEGSVKVSSSRQRAATGYPNAVAILKPNQQAILTNNTINCVQVDANATVDWKNGEFIFKDERIENIMRKVARWYDVEVVYAKDAPKDIELGGVVSRSRNVSAVLKMMELTNRVKFKIEGKTIYVSR